MIEKCDGRVSGMGQAALANTRPSRASRSMAGVVFAPPYAPRASARSVSTVTRTMFGGTGVKMGVDRQAETVIAAAAAMASAPPRETIAAIATLPPT
jgi:hypothetical protein